MIHAMTDEQIIKMMKLPENRNFLAKLVDKEGHTSVVTNPPVEDFATGALANNCPLDGDGMAIVIDENDMAKVYITVKLDRYKRGVACVDHEFKLPDDLAEILSIYISEEMWYYCIILNKNGHSQIVSLGTNAYEGD